MISISKIVFADDFLACGYVFEGTTIALERLSWINLSLSVGVNIIITTLAGQ
jgi:hypothetical protein